MRVCMEIADGGAGGEGCREHPSMEKLAQRGRGLSGQGRAC